MRKIRAWVFIRGIRGSIKCSLQQCYLKEQPRRDLISDVTLADKMAMPGRAVMSRATPRCALQAARAEAAPRSPSAGSPLLFLAGGRTVADAVLGTGFVPQPCSVYHPCHWQCGGWGAVVICKRWPPLTYRCTDTDAEQQTMNHVSNVIIKGATICPSILCPNDEINYGQKTAADAPSVADAHAEQGQEDTEESGGTKQMPGRHLDPLS